VDFLSFLEPKFGALQFCLQQKEEVSSTGAQRTSFFGTLKSGLYKLLVFTYSYRCIKSI